MPYRLEVVLSFIKQTALGNFLDLEGHQHCITGSIVTAMLLNRWISPIGGVASGRVSASSLRIRLFLDNFIFCESVKMD